MLTFVSRPMGTGWLLDVPQAICKGLDATVGTYTGSWTWGGDVDEMRGPGVSRTTSMCLQWFGAPWWDLHMVSRTQVSRLLEEF